MDEYPYAVSVEWASVQAKAIKNKLQIHFQSKKKSSGGDCRVETAGDDSARATVFFKCNEVKRRVLARDDHEITIEKASIKLHLSPAATKDDTEKLSQQTPPKVDNVAAVTIMAMPMKEPVCLIESDSDGRLRVVPSALKILEQIEQKVVVVSVVGLYRTGKSYLMNKLAGENKGFPLGAAVESKTKGIWMWCVRHPMRADHTLVLLDTEGLGDIRLGNTKHDNWIFAMAVLLSSTLVYNSMGTIDNKSLENLHFVTELTKHIRMKSSKDEEEDDRTFVRVLPSFVWAVRDFCLKLEVNGKTITADEYLEHGLREEKGQDEKYNIPRACLRKFFWPRSCFVFERPAKPDIMQVMEKKTDADLDPDFVEQAKRFTQHIYTKSQTKTVGNGIRVTGKMLGQLAETYVEAIRGGKVPCLENAVMALAEIEHAKAVEQALVLYGQRMQSVCFPTKTLEELSAIHASSEKVALELFMKCSFRDYKQKYQKKLVIALQTKYNEICEKNVDESRKACGQIIKQVFGPLEETLVTGLYAAPGGYKRFLQDLQTLTDTYRRAEGRGVKAEEVLKTYLDEKANIIKALLVADKTLSGTQRRAEEEKRKRDESEREKPAMVEQHEAQLRRLADQQKTLEELLNQLGEKRERDQMLAREEHEKLVADFTEQKRISDSKEEERRIQDQADVVMKQRQEEAQQDKAWYGQAIGGAARLISGSLFGPVVGSLVGHFARQIGPLVGPLVEKWAPWIWQIGPLVRPMVEQLAPSVGQIGPLVRPMVEHLAPLSNGPIVKPKRCSNKSKLK